jgi:hypothetical protein
VTIQLHTLPTRLARLGSPPRNDSDRDTTFPEFISDPPPIDIVTRGEVKTPDPSLLLRMLAPRDACPGIAGGCRGARRETYRIVGELISR